MAIKRKLNFGFGTNPDNINMSALPPSALGQIGGVYEVKDNGWQMYQLVDAGPSVAGDLGYDKGYSNSGLYCNATRTIGNSTQNEVAGVFTTAVTLNYFTLLRKKGVFNVKSADSTINARGLGITSDTSANRVILQAGSVKTIGIAQAAQSTGFVSALLNINYI